MTLTKPWRKDLDVKRTEKGFHPNQLLSEKKMLPHVPNWMSTFLFVSSKTREKIWPIPFRPTYTHKAFPYFTTNRVVVLWMRPSSLYNTRPSPYITRSFSTSNHLSRPSHPQLVVHTPFFWTTVLVSKGIVFFTMDVTEIHSTANGTN